MQNPASFVHNVLHWFADHSRDLPWRRTYLPYHIWISEIMLQQTQMERVVTYFTRWIKRFPDIRELAAADEDEVLKHWEGLGYYSRARNLHKAAKRIALDSGKLPESHDKLLALPGIGPYTAGAIMSIAFNRDHPVVDANIERLFSRLYNISTPIKNKENKAFVWHKARELLPPGKSRLFNQALMELGALVCLPKTPRCKECPASKHCRAYELDLAHERPILSAKKKTIEIEMATGILTSNNTMLIQKRLQDDVWANLWEFPGGRLKQGESPEEALVREFSEETGLRVGITKKIATVKHSYMHYRVTLHGFYCQVVGDEKGEPACHAAQENRWVTLAELNQFAFPAGHRKIIDFINKIDTQNK